MTVTPPNPVPFLVGFVITAIYAVYVVVELAWTARNNVRAPWDYDSDVRQAYAYFKQTWREYNWWFIALAPVLSGGLTYVVWWTVYLLARWWA